MPESSSEPRVLFTSSFLELQGGSHGGVRRAQQIFELLRRADSAVAVAHPLRDTAVGGLRHADWGAALQYARGVRASPPRRARIALGFARNYGDWRRGLSRYPQARVLVWESTIDSMVLHAAKGAGLRVVAVPQNLETLVPGAVEPRTGQTMPWSLEHELRQLAAADAVYTISREEQWLLRLRGIAAEYLPFFPDAACQNAWLAVRAGRAQRREPPAGFVLLGSAVNPPTRAGVRELLTWLRAHASPAAPEMHVVGYGTEVFKDFESPGIHVHGAVGEAALHALLVRARAVVLHQTAAVGALTRISEILLAGVPILASPTAARSTDRYRGVVTYESFADLRRLLLDDWPTPPIPEPPELLERAFLRQISDWAGGPTRLATTASVI